MTENDSDKIRQKRLAKLGVAISAGTRRSESAERASSPELEIDRPKEQRSVAAVPEKEIDAGSQSNMSAPARVNIIINRSAATQAQKHTQRVSPQAAAGSGRSGDDDVSSWEDRQLRSFLRISIDPQSTSDSSGHSLQYLPGLHEDLGLDGSVARLSTSHLDQALTEAGTIAARNGRDPFDYLLACWKRVARAHRNARASNAALERINILAEARRLCMSYCLFAITFPEMFADEPQQRGKCLLQHLTTTNDDDVALDYDFLAEASTRLEEDDSVKDVLVEVACQISQHLATKTMLDEYKPYVTAFSKLMHHPKLVHAITQSPSFLPGPIGGPELETRSILGPFFRLSPAQVSMAKYEFSAPRSRDRGWINNVQSSIQMVSSTHQEFLFGIVNAIVKTGKDPRERMLDWFAATVNSNHNRRAMRPDPAKVSSDGFMINVTAVLDLLCDPFIGTFDKVDKVDVAYLRRAPRVDISDETKINADQKESESFHSQNAEGTNNFISEVFFLTIAAHHYGLEAANSQLEQAQKNVKHMEEDLASAEAERAKIAASDPRALSLFDVRLSRFKDALDTRIATIHATQGIILEKTMQGRSMQLMRFVIVWLLRLASGKKVPDEKVALPLSPDQPKAFKCLPEYLLQDVVDNFKFITRHLPGIVTTTQCEELVTICISFLSSSDYVKSPYLKAGLVSILCYGIWPTYSNRNGVLGDLLGGMSFCHEHLLHALMKFYIEAESTGSHTQFYDKFNIRYEIDTIIKRIWPNSVYRDKLAKEASLNKDFFVRFVNLLLNDVTFVLDESFTAFQKIHELLEELRRPDALDEATRKEKEEALSEHKKRAKDYMGLTNETISMLKLFTEALAESFTMPEVVQRLADMLDYNLDIMTGPKQATLKVEAPEEYGFRPKELLSDLVDVYLNLRHQQRFHLAVARDGRSYTPARFNKALDLVCKKVAKSGQELANFRELANTIEAAYAADQQAEEDLGEIPDELQDPLMGTLMEDPVILPSSRQIVDRSTIRSHLLSDASDPFNRVPLKIEDVIPADDKKREIEEFVAARKAQKMDTGPG